MKRTLLLMLLLGIFTAPAFAQKKKKKDKEAEIASELSKNILADSVNMLNAAARGACECIDRSARSLTDKKAINDSAAKCIEDAVGPIQLMMQLAAAMASADEKKDKQINITMGGGDDYRRYYFKIERWLKDSCGILDTLLSSRDVKSDHSMSENEKALKAYYEGVALMKKEEYEKAKAYFLTAVKEDSLFAFAWDDLGICYRKTGKYTEAVAAYKQSLAIDPEGRLPLQNLPIVYSLMEKYDEAIAAYNDILKYYPNDAEVEYGIGLIYFLHKNDAEKALPYMCKAYNIYVKEKSPYRSDAEKVINNIYSAMKKDKKEELFFKILEEHNIKGR